MQLINMKTALIAMAAARAVNAHTTFTNFYVDGTNQGAGTCVRMSNNIQQATYPISSVTSDDMACGEYIVPYTLIWLLPNLSGQVTDG